MNNDHLQQNGHNGGKHELQLTIEGKQYNWCEEYITGTQLKHLANIPPDVELYLSIKEPWEDELISNEEKVNLARPEIEHFYCKKKLEIIINGDQYNWFKQFITGAEVKVLAGIEMSSELFLAITRPWEDELITNDISIDLARPGIEHFYSKKLGEEKLVTIHVNNIERKISRGKHTVSEIKKIGEVQATYELTEVIEGKLIPLDDNAVVLIKGCEIFFSQVRDGSSS